MKLSMLIAARLNNVCYLAQQKSRVLATLDLFLDIEKKAFQAVFFYLIDIKKISVGYPLALKTEPPSL